ncbi:MAG TPA: ABC transporter permease [Bryobacteraceae bacterium]|nr:ABC transporter permease [Bryobacteraceae bacterium]
MLLRFVRESISRAPRRKALIVAAIAMGSAVATAMLGVMLDIGDKVNRELRAVGANIAVTPANADLTGGLGQISAAPTGARSYIREADVVKVKSIFWGLNILGFSPSVSARDAAPLEGVWFRHSYVAPSGETQTTGLPAVNPAWKVVEGRWPNDDASEAIAGAALARRNHWQTGMDIAIFGAPFRLTGILSSGEEADDTLFLPLAKLQKLTEREGQVDAIAVAALTKPEDDFARRDPKTMSKADYERWSCSNYAISMAYEIEEAIPGSEAHPVRRVADSEGKILDRVGGLMGLITLAALISAGLTVWSLTATTMMERRGEVAIMQAIGAGRSLIATLFGFEIALVGLIGGLIGAFTGVALAHFVGWSVFHDNIEVSPLLPFLAMLAAVVVALAGAAQPLRRTLNLDPAVTLREGL